MKAHCPSHIEWDLDCRYCFLYAKIGKLEEQNERLRQELLKEKALQGKRVESIRGPLDSKALDEKVQEIMKTRYQYVDVLLAAVLKENGCKASELELVEKHEGTTIVWTVMKKEKAKNAGPRIDPLEWNRTPTPEDEL